MAIIDMFSHVVSREAVGRPDWDGLALLYESSTSFGDYRCAIGGYDFCGDHHVFPFEIQQASIMRLDRLQLIVWLVETIRQQVVALPRNLAPMA